MLNRDFKDMLCALNDARADYVVVGAYALAAHGYPRATGDIDILVRPDAQNAARVLLALQAFGAPLFQLSVDDLATTGTLFQIGVPPGRIDILTAIEGISFEEAWATRLSSVVDGVPIAVLGREALLKNKRTVGRPKDLADVATLEGRGEERRPKKASSRAKRSP